jgi:hypothetical protein
VRGLDARAETFQMGLHQAAVVAAMWLRALLLGGLGDRADHAAKRYRERCQDTPGLGM